MSKRSCILRYSLILNKLRTKSYCSYEELKKYIENELEFRRSMDDTLEMGFSKRTLQRDVREIGNLWGYHIEYSKANKGYYLTESLAESENFQRMIEAFDMFNSLTLSQDLAPFVHLEKRQPQGTENLYGLIHAIKNSLRIKFSYQKFWEKEISERQADPYALKEFRDRWYVIAKDNKDNKIKTFALDRLSSLAITERKFKRPKEFNVHDRYRNYFGIITPEEETPKEVVLSFEPVQGKYIKTLPLHETQQILKETEYEVLIKLKICITQDFIMELLSFGSRVKVVKPKFLANTIKKEHRLASQLN